MFTLHILVIVAVLFSQVISSKVCTISGDCVHYAMCENGICTCNSGKVFSADGKKCLDISPGLGSPCLERSQCAGLISGGVVCTAEGLCACQDGYIYSKYGCTPVKTLNEDCTGTECFDGVDLFALQCKGGKCICNEGYYTRNGTDCRPSAETTDECLLDIDCKNGQFCNFEYGPYGKCASYKLKNTMEDFIYLTEDKTDNNYLDIPCLKERDCSVSNSFCALFTKKCACKDSFVYDKNTNQCVKALGEECSEEENENCPIRNSFCNKDHLCQCDKYYIYGKYYEKCFKPTRHLGDSCGRDENCYSFGKNAICKNNKCECGYGTEYDPINMLCTSAPKECEDPCEKCSVIDHSTCIYSKCVCLKDYTAENMMCLPDIGSQCNERKDDCVIPNAECNEFNSCQCKEGFIQNNNRECVKEDECKKCDLIAHSFCDFSECRCEPDYTTENGACLPDLGSECNEGGDDCIITNAECDLINYCHCKDGFIQNNNRECIEEPEDPCKKCETIAHSTCNDNECVCLKDYTEENDKCLPDIGSQCNEVKDDCLISNAECDQNNACMCKEGFILDKNRECVKAKTESNITNNYYISFNSYKCNIFM